MHPLYTHQVNDRWYGKWIHTTSFGAFHFPSGTFGNILVSSFGRKFWTTIRLPFPCCYFHLYIHSSFSISISYRYVWVGYYLLHCTDGDRDLRRRSVGRICSLGWWCISGFKCQSSICATTRRRCGLSSDQSRILFDQPQRKKCMRYSWLQMGRVVISGGTEIIGENTWWRFLIR